MLPVTTSSPGVEKMVINEGTYPAGWGGDYLRGDLPVAQGRSISQGRVGGRPGVSSVTTVYNF
jgi:hypothetical protein